MFKVKVLCLLACVSVIASFMPTSNAEALVGGVHQLNGDDLKEAEEKLQGSLTKLAAGDGPTYKLGKVHSASRQVVSGSLYIFSADLVDDSNEVKLCNVRIWSQPWLEKGIQVTFECDGEEKVVKKHSA